MVSNRYKGFVCCAKQNNEHRNSYLVSNTYKRLDKYFLCVFFHFPPFSHVCEIPIHEVQKWEYGIDQRASKHNVSIIWELARKSFGPHPKPKDSLRSLCPIECDSQIPNAAPSIPTSWNSHSCVVLPWVYCLPSKRNITSKKRLQHTAWVPHCLDSLDHWLWERQSEGLLDIWQLCGEAHGAISRTHAQPSEWAS